MRHFVEQYTTDDKSTWERGPWDDEPDKVVWVDEATGLDCMAHRNHSGAWCGYVGVPEGHRAFGRDYDDLPVVCHGGLTYACGCQETADPAVGLCHIPQSGRPDKVWWLGFDCAHYMDRMPAMEARLREIHKERPDFPDILDAPFGPQQYRDLAYVVDEVEQLASQLAALN
jgi:hypothetical protein